MTALGRGVLLVLCEEASPDSEEGCQVIASPHSTEQHVLSTLMNLQGLFFGFSMKV